MAGRGRRWCALAGRAGSRLHPDLQHCKESVLDRPRHRVAALGTFESPMLRLPSAERIRQSADQRRFAAAFLTRNRGHSLGFQRRVFGGGHDAHPLFHGLAGAQSPARVLKLR